MTTWPWDVETIPILDDASISVARERVRQFVGEVGLSRDVIESIATAATELVRNQLLHASGGRFAVRSIERGGLRGLELVAADRGSGLANP